MIGQIIGIDDNILMLKLSLKIENVQNLINLFVLVTDNDKNFIGEIISIKENIAQINLLGEYRSSGFVYGITAKPAFGAKVNLIAEKEVSKILSVENYNEKKHVIIGTSPYYKDVTVAAKINSLYGEHFAIMGSTGSGKSCGFARLMQNLFYRNNAPVNSNFFIFDAYAEYHNAFKDLNVKNNSMHFKVYTTNPNSLDELIKIPLWLLDVDDISLLLGVQDTNQIPVVEKALKFVSVFARTDENVRKNKNSIIAKALIDILLSGRKPAQIRDQFFSVLTKYKTEDLNLDTQIVQPGYIRTIKQCLNIDEDGKIRAVELVIKFLQEFIVLDMKMELPDGSFKYDLEDLCYAFDFALIDEGILRNENLFNATNYLKVRLDTIYNSNNKKYFEYPEYISINSYIEKLTTTKSGNRAQVINFNINYIDDRLAKAITKIYAKMLFKYSMSLSNRATQPFHIILEEAHRYVQNDSDTKIIGYNIFERIAKEGRKYGVILGLITQRPSELSETVLSQCNNFMLFKMIHPVDIDFISRMIPNITSGIIKQMKTLQPGTCMTFGTAFKIPLLTKMDMPDPSPSSNSCDVSGIWFNNN